MYSQTSRPPCCKMGVMKHVLKISVSVVLLFIIAVLCLSIALLVKEGTKVDKPAQNIPSTTLPPPRYFEEGWRKVSQLFKISINASVNPCQDFYAYACGGWVATHEDGDKWTKLLQKIVDENATKALSNVPSGTSKTLRTLKILFEGCENTTTDTFIGGARLKDLVAMYGGWPVLRNDWSWDRDVPKKFQDFLYMTGYWYAKYAIGTLFLPSILMSTDRVGRNALELTGPLLQALDDCYLEQTDCLEDLRILMKNVTTILAGLWQVTNMNATRVAMDVDDMLQFETDIANITSKEDQPQTGYYNLSTAQALWPRVHIEKYMQALFADVFGYADIYRLISQTNFSIADIDYVTKLNDHIFTKYDNMKGRRIMMNYFLWRVIFEYLPYAGPPFQSPWNAYVTSLRKRPSFLMKKTAGKIRALRTYPLTQEACFTYMTEIAPFAMGRAYTDYNFGQEKMEYIEKDILHIVYNARAAFREVLAGLQWLDEQSKPKALQKLDNMIVNVLNANFAKSDQDLDAYYGFLNGVIAHGSNASDFFDVMLAQTEYAVGWMLLPLNRYGVDRTAWTDGYTPLMVNAWYDPKVNSFTIPAAILNSPYYQWDFPYAVIYGAIGSVIGHELTHGFDRQGSLYDKNGMQRPWMTNESYAGLQEMGTCLVQQYSMFCYDNFTEQLCLNGNQTEDENLADNGGIKAAFRAYVDIARLSPEPALPDFPQLNMQQIFFLAFAQLNCQRSSMEQLAEQIRVDPHSPGRDRIIGTLRNFKPFADTWRCKFGDGMFNENSCAVW